MSDTVMQACRAISARTLRGLYVITDGRLRGQALTDAVDAAIRGGAVLVQYRDKSPDSERRRTEAAALQTLCARHEVYFLINDDLELAIAVGADGVHLGRDDAEITTARQRLGADAIIGVSCYNELEHARHAVALGADYLAFGSFFPSTVKPGAVKAGPDLLRAARAQFTVPIVAIGGITPDNGPLLVEAGADMLAVITGVFGETDIRGAAARYAYLFDDTRRDTEI